MAGPLTLVERTTDGEMASAAQVMIVYAFTLTAGSDAATAVFKNGGSSGTARLTLKAPAGETVVAPMPGGVMFEKGVYVDLTGTSPAASVAYG